MKRRSALKMEESNLGNKSDNMENESQDMFEPDVVLEETYGKRSTPVRKLTAEEKKALVREQTAERVRRYRERQKLLKAQQRMKTAQVKDETDSENFEEEEKQLKTLHSITIEPDELYNQQPTDEVYIIEPEVNDMFVEENEASETSYGEPERSEGSFKIKREHGYVYRPRKKDTSHDEKLAELRRKAAERVRRYRDRKKLQQESLKLKSHKNPANSTSKANKNKAMGQKVLMYQVPRMKLPASAKKHSQNISKELNSIARMRKQAAIRNQRYRERKRNLKSYSELYVEYTESAQFSEDLNNVMSVLPDDLSQRKILLQHLLEDVNSKILNREKENETENIEVQNSSDMMNPLLYLQLQPTPDTYENYEYLEEAEKC